MPNSKPKRYDALPRTWHDDLVKAMGIIARAGPAAGKLADPLRWRRLSSEEFLMKNVLERVEAEGHAARDVLDMMEDNDAK